MSKLSVDKISVLARLGLARDKIHIGYYIDAMRNPQETVNDSFRRQYAADVLDHLLDILAENQQIYDQVRYALERDYQPGTYNRRPWMDETAMAAIEAKAINSNIPTKVLLELYDRGYNQEPRLNMTREQQAFNCINSFISKGKAYRDYPDLVEMSNDVDQRLWGTDSLAQIYAKATPGQSGNNLNTQQTNKRGTFDTIKKVIKK